jgi:hypothetical protein
MVGHPTHNYLFLLPVKIIIPPVKLILPPVKVKHWPTTLLYRSSKLSDKVDDVKMKNMRFGAVLTSNSLSTQNFKVKNFVLNESF